VVLRGPDSGGLSEGRRGGAPETARKPFGFISAVAGGRELLLHGRNPYSDETTVEIQKGYYGRALDAARAEDPKDRKGFAYPAYVVFVLAPLIGFPFPQVQIFFSLAAAGADRGERLAVVARAAMEIARAGDGGRDGAGVGVVLRRCRGSSCSS